MDGGLAAYVAQRRRVLGLTQQALADRAGVTRDVVAQIESGKSKLPVPDNRRRLAEALGVRHVDLLVAAGELTPDEIAPLPETHVTDFRLQELIDDWADMTPEAQRHVHSLLAVPGIVVREEPRVAALAR
jgi:transcriptional regulator with XRE-family HTH domain